MMDGDRDDLGGSTGNVSAGGKDVSDGGHVMAVIVGMARFAV